MNKKDSEVSSCISRTLARKIARASGQQLKMAQVIILAALKKVRRGVGRRRLTELCGLTRPKSKGTGRYSSNWLWNIADLERRGLLSLEVPLDDHSKEYIHVITEDGLAVLAEAEQQLKEEEAENEDTNKATTESLTVKAQ